MLPGESRGESIAIVSDLRNTKGPEETGPAVCFSVSALAFTSPLVPGNFREHDRRNLFKPVQQAATNVQPGNKGG
jgi:hypothetical protein